VRDKTIFNYIKSSIIFVLKLANATGKLRFVTLKLEDVFVQQKELLEKTVVVVTHRTITVGMQATVHVFVSSISICLIYGGLLLLVVSPIMISWLIYLDDLQIDYQFTFNLSKKEDRHYRKINFRNTPTKPDIDADFLITCSMMAKMNISYTRGNHRSKQSI